MVGFSAVDGDRSGELSSVPDIADVLSEILSRPAVEGVRLVGIDGPSGSGKSTFARALADAAAAPLIETDDFASWIEMADWWPRFEEQVLGPLFGGSDARYQVRDWVGDEFGSSLRDWKSLRWSPFVVMEGVTCMRRAVADRLAYAVWVDAPEELRLRRGLDRDGVDHRHLWVRWQAEEARFLAEDRTRERADLIIDTSGDRG